MQFKNQDLPIFHKGQFEPVNRDFLKETVVSIKPLLEIQKNTTSWTTTHFSTNLKTA